MRDALKAACDAVPGELQGLLHADEIRAVVWAFLEAVADVAPEDRGDDWTESAELAEAAGVLLYELDQR